MLLVWLMLHHITFPIRQPNITLRTLHLHVLSREVSVNDNATAITPPWWNLWVRRHGWPLYVYVLISFGLPIGWEVDSWLGTGGAEERQIALSHLLVCVMTKSKPFPVLQISPDPRDPHQLTVTVLE